MVHTFKVNAKWSIVFIMGFSSDLAYLKGEIDQTPNQTRLKISTNSNIIFLLLFLISIALGFYFIYQRYNFWRRWIELGRSFFSPWCSSLHWCQLPAKNLKQSQRALYKIFSYLIDHTQLYFSVKHKKNITTDSWNFHHAIRAHSSSPQ